MGMDYKLILVLGVELEHHTWRFNDSVTKYDPDTGVPYQKEIPGRLDIFSFKNETEVIQMKVGEYDWNGYPLDKDINPVLAILPDKFKLFPCYKSCLGIILNESKSTSGGNSIVSEMPNVSDEDYQYVKNELLKMGETDDPKIFTVLAVSY